MNLGVMTNAKASSLAFPFDLDSIQMVSVGFTNRKISSRMTVLYINVNIFKFVSEFIKLCLEVYHDFCQLFELKHE
jgi:hypothetical protein